MYYTLWHFNFLFNIVAETILILTTLTVAISILRFLIFRNNITTYTVTDSNISLVSLLAGILPLSYLVFFYFIQSQNSYIYFTSNSLQGYLVNSTRKKLSHIGDVEIFSIMMVFLANYIGVISKTTLDTRLRLDNLNFTILILYFNLILVYFVNTNSFLEFFLLYEFLLIPSFLIVYLTGYSRRTINSSIYFLVWTQLGSIMVLCAFIILVFVLKIESFELSRFYIVGNGNIELLNFTLCLLILGFGAKVPLWPFHYWITKTHVEAPTGFSIYLSGFLVKTAIFGIYKTLNIMNLDFNLYPFICLIVLGFLDSSFKFWTQSDVKKLVAYCTIQEMNLIMLIFIFGNTKLINTGILFVITHALLSGLMFYVVDCIYRRFGSRSVVEVHGILNTCPNLACIIILMQLCFVGLPGTVKFLVEFNLMSGLLWNFPRTTTFIMIINIIGVIGFSKVWFNLIFGTKVTNKTVFLDLTFLELTITLSLITLQLFFTYYFQLLI